MLKRREIRRRRSRVRRGISFFSRGIGLFKLAVGLVAIASVLFLVPGLRLLVPGLQNIGTKNIQAMPAKDPGELEKAPAEPAQTGSDDLQAHRALNFSGDDELGLTGVFQDRGELGFSVGGSGTGGRRSEVIDVGDELLGPEALPDTIGDSGSVLSSDLPGGISR